MTAYNKSLNFTALGGTDSLAGIFDTEFNLVSTAINSKANTASPTFTGTVVVPTIGATVSHTGDPAKTSPARSNEVYMHTFKTGVQSVFYQATAPLGWSQVTTAALNDSLLRVVTSGGGVTGGTAGIVGTPLAATDAHAVTIAEMPAHTHTTSALNSIGSGVAGAIGGYGQINITSSSSGGGGGHTHPITWTPKYSDFIVCSKL